MKLALFKRIPRTPDERKELRKQRLLLLLSGLLLAAGFPPVPWPITLFFGMVPYLLVLEKRERLIDLNRAAFLMSFTFSIFALYWVGAFTEMKDPYLMAGGVVLFFINPIAFMVPTTLYYFTRKYISRQWALWLLPFFWIFYEYIYTLTDWSFPWLNLGNGTSNFTYFIQIADTFGVWGLSFIIVVINVLLYFAYMNTQQKKLAVLYVSTALFIFMVVLLYGVYSLPPLPLKQRNLVTVGVVQPNLDPYDKWAGNNADEILTVYLNDSRKLLSQNVDVLIWPETALPVYFMGGPYSDLRDRLFGFIDSAKVPLFTGMPDIRYFEKNDSAKPYDVKYNKRGDYYYASYNAIYMIHPDSRSVQKYGKNKLVPFGERVPFVDQLPLLGEIMRWGVGIGGWNVGQDTNVIKLYRPYKNDTIAFCGAICYESIYTDAIVPQILRGAQAIIVVTNDSWYGNTSGTYQHRDFAKIRAVETRRYVIRAANGGISCVINENGVLEEQTKMYEHTTLRSGFRAMSVLTFYVKHPHLIVWPCTIISLGALLTALLLKYYRKIKKTTADGLEKSGGNQESL
ncbi:MAG: apolipoprotein N-acyltransferase [Ignavibacteriales bacterium]|nr:apolipoprotein N-acyltransferase [Ignavibacteriales bacterium]